MVAELKVLGEIDERALRVEFGVLQTAEVIVTEERIKHIRERHPQDIELFDLYGKETITAPDRIVKDVKNAGTVFMIMHLPHYNINVVVRLALKTEDERLKNSVMTFYRIRTKNLVKLLRKNKEIYRREII